MLEKFDLLSVNQTAAQIKLMEAWKASREAELPNIQDTKQKQTKNIDLSRAI